MGRTSADILLQRAQRPLRTYPRIEAAYRLRTNGTPVVYHHRDRYAPYGHAIEKLGLDQTLLLAADRRSLLLWPTMPGSAHAAALLLARTVHSDYRAGEDPPQNFRAVHALVQGSPLAPLAQGLADDWARLTALPDGQLSTVPRDIGELQTYTARLLEVAAIGLLHHGETVTVQTVRILTADLIGTPNFVIRQVQAGEPLALLYNPSQHPPIRGSAADTD